MGTTPVAKTMRAMPQWKRKSELKSNHHSERSQPDTIWWSCSPGSVLGSRETSSGSRLLLSVWLDVSCLLGLRRTNWASPLWMHVRLGRSADILGTGYSACIVPVLFVLRLGHRVDRDGRLWFLLPVSCIPASFRAPLWWSTVNQIGAIAA